MDTKKCMMWSGWWMAVAKVIACGVVIWGAGGSRGRSRSPTIICDLSVRCCHSAFSCYILWFLITVEKVLACGMVIWGAWGSRGQFQSPISISDRSVQSWCFLVLSDFECKDSMTCWEPQVSSQGSCHGLGQHKLKVKVWAIPGSIWKKSICVAFAKKDSTF